MNTPHQKYTFDTEFFEVVGGPAGHTTIPQAHAAMNPRQKAYDEGYANGLREGQQQAQADLQKLQQHLQNTIISLQRSVEERETQLLTQSLALLRVTLHHLLGHVVAHFPDELLEEHLRNLLPLLKTDEALTLRIHPAARGYHEKLQLPHASIMGLPMHILTDPNLGLTDAVVEWKNGGAESKLAQHLKAVDTLLAASAIPQLPTPPMPTQPANLQEAPPPSLAAPAQAAVAAPPSPVEQAARAAQSRAAELLGDDELVDALKS